MTQLNSNPQRPDQESISTQMPVAAGKRKERTDETIKETLESIIVAFILAFIFRAFVIEAFVIPTGSMAPTLLGQHVQIKCEQCGYHFDIGVDPEQRDMSRGQQGIAVRALPETRSANCPMCHFPNPVPRGTVISPGDRILVHKYIYSLIEPKRWDVVVFKYPGKPADNYIKRLIGLPGESLWIIDGNIFTKPANTKDDAWLIARKTQREQVQRAVWQPIYHSRYVPLDQGQQGLVRAGEFSWTNPWTATTKADEWEIQNRRSFLYKGVTRGTIRFDFNQQIHQRLGLYEYNQFNYFGVDPVEDIRLATRIQPLGPGLTLTLQTTARLGVITAPRVIRAVIDAFGEARIEVLDFNFRVAETVARTHINPLPAHRSTAVEFWYADQEASLWIEGQRVLVWQDNPSMNVILQRDYKQLFPEIAIDLQGASAILHDVELDRDLYYTSHHQARRAVYFRTTKTGSPINLEADQFFCLGDNSPNSSDGRIWSELNPWIEERMLAQNTQQLGVVPRKLMIGKAFFVYFPAPYTWNRQVTGVLPNFSDLRFIH